MLLKKNLVIYFLQKKMLTIKDHNSIYVKGKIQISSESPSVVGAGG